MKKIKNVILFSAEALGCRMLDDDPDLDVE